MKHLLQDGYYEDPACVCCHHDTLSQVAIITSKVIYLSQISELDNNHCHKNVPTSAGEATPCCKLPNYFATEWKIICTESSLVVTKM